MEGTGADGAPVLRVVRGEPTADELAALVAVLTARSRSTRSRPAVRPSGWSDRSRLLRSIPRPGPGAWAASGQPLT
jgi:hypothetical protein